jgi:hypothetical protein
LDRAIAFAVIPFQRIGIAPRCVDEALAQGRQPDVVRVLRVVSVKRGLEARVEASAIGPRKRNACRDSGEQHGHADNEGENQEGSDATLQSRLPPRR